eukprot:TRINITY_DN543_c0_g1_i1.p1 TRINITY_DN543_c0_g1~~TRINITY_DN543_c0_g1_i1.p1  ORF type:complete len:179 (+),score=63.94 TRINITY_DN543_c0_g1_i1:114-650(+)
MGNMFSYFFDFFWPNKQARILILGLDGAGKTTLLYKLQSGEVVQTLPTIGFNVESFTYKNTKFQAWDLGGQSTIRPYWRCYLVDTLAVIFVVDSADPDRLTICKEELHNLFMEEELKNASLLVLANKQDLPGALSDSQISEGLKLTSLRNRNWSIFKTSVVQGSGLMESLEWLVNAIK